ncbi:S-adenosyl-L-methionine-dependent methyltransferase [Ophiobolus disseminans]|uniref:S-adenosyl-L-methionine-dependent methyltransferase n=1 Tax=Ophiobolus disseminans TaxID=1469910 RepID=A0A6A6ZDW7_9PLEO|nr:S-adenosyl-L-methionine-dependent methyltransferase [Ophiobolus disseminans]
MSEDRQSVNAIRFYEGRSRDYDDTWHSDFTRRFLSHIDLQPGQEVLDLACGTGLLTFKEADIVGPTGKVVGVDVTPGMIAIASRKKEQNGDKYANVSLHKGDILHLDETEALKGKTFDVITVASALVLFPDPKAAIEHWSGYLKPGGVLVTDATHPRNLVSGMVLERVARRLDLPIPYNRSWSQSESTLKHTLESAGLEVESVITVHNQAGYGKRYYDIEQWDDFFVENVIVKDVAKTFASNDIRRKAQGVYKDEWEKLAIDGKVEEIDAVFLAVARKAADGSRFVPKPTCDDDIVFNGGCRCGEVQYTSSASPSDITLCYCRACQQLSGSSYLPFISTRKAAFKFTASSTIKTLKLSDVAERTFCASCGTPLTMAYSFFEDEISITMGSIDTESFTCEPPKVKNHIYLAEKAPWVTVPDDGTERWGTHELAHLIPSKKDD